MALPATLARRSHHLTPPSGGGLLHPVHSVFNHPGARRAWLWLRHPIALAALALVALNARPDLLIPGLALSLAGEAIQVWSFAALVKDRELTARGPYVLVRNPMYLGRYLVLLGFVLATGSLVAVAVFTGIYGFYMVNRVRREEARLTRDLGEPYRQYCATVPRYLPDLTRLGDRAVRYFSFGHLRANHGTWNLLAVVLSWAVVITLVGTTKG